MIQVITDKDNWEKHISNFEVSDFYHTYDYHNIAKGDGQPQLLIYTEGTITIGLPLLIRKIPDTVFYDATSVYGYSGPLYKNLPANFDNTQFSQTLIEHFKSQKIITVFSRLNPFISEQHRVFHGIGTLEQKGVVVSIDLSKNITQQRTEFRRRLKGQLNKARRHLSIRVADDDGSYQQFVDVYWETMKRLNARPMYFFDDLYFKTLAKSESFETKTLLAIHNETGKTIGASMFIYKDSVVHYHLSGSKAEYKDLMPTKLLIDEMRIMATELGLDNLNLGGGLSSANDSLLQFKTSYSKNLLDFYVWKLVVIPDIYTNLIEKQGLKNEPDYFPLYRLEEI
ncbi:GNAT family N-acetyltransferase [Flagellimonas sp.]|uniref:GNAT family N-acetyltransferase n=1 Tax=Flagellimonas sp. TaxID=2058762 RepID=UPI003F4A7C52